MVGRLLELLSVSQWMKSEPSEVSPEVSPACLADDDGRRVDDPSRSRHPDTTARAAWGA